MNFSNGRPGLLGIPYLPMLLLSTVGVLAASGMPIEAVADESASEETDRSTSMPVEHRLEDEVSPRAADLPDGIFGIAVPANVSTPAAVYQTPQGEQRPSGLKLRETPVPLEAPPTDLAPPFPGTNIEPGAEAEQSGLGVDPPMPDAPASTVKFDSLDFDDNSANTGGGLYIPPDPIGAAGPNHVVSVVNVSIQFHDKTGTPLLDAVPGVPVTGISLQSFFAPLSPANATFDPKVIYDQHAERFVVVTLERTSSTSRILVAVSDDSDPNGTWYFAAINSKINIGGVDRWADYPGLAVDEEAVYITANMFAFSNNAFGGTRLWIINKVAGAGGGLYGGGTATVSLYNPVPATAYEGTTQPAHVFGTTPTSPTNVGTWLTLYSGLASSTDSYLQVVRVDNPVGPGTTTFVGPTFVNMGAIDDLSGALPDAPQSGSSELIETNDRRTYHSVWRDDLLYVVTTINPETGDPNHGQATAHWVELNANTAGVTLSDQGDVGGEELGAGIHTFFPSIAVNDSLDVAIGFSASGSSIFPSSAYTTRAMNDLAGVTTGATLLRAGLAYYVRTFDDPPCSSPPARNRWGDYSGIAVDPFDQCFWVFNEHAISRGTGTTGGCNGRPATEDGRWGTAFGHFCESCPTNLILSSLTVNGTEIQKARDTLSASTVVVEGTGSLSLTSSIVSLGNGFRVEELADLVIANGPCN